MNKPERKLAKWFKKAEKALTRKEALKAIKKAEKWFERIEEGNGSD